MNITSPLSRPIVAEITRDGRLITADEALRNLNIRAGGSEGEAVAIPALYSLCLLAARLGMRLARALKVSDEAEHLELWVEAEPSDDVIKISILGWRNLGEHLAIANTDRNAGITASDDHPILRFDKTLRLIRTSGRSVQGLTAADFGEPASGLFPKLLASSDIANDLLQSMDRMAAFVPVIVLLNDGERALLSGVPMFEGNADCAGYECQFEKIPVDDGDPSQAAAAPNPVALFGKHLAPALRQPLGRIIANAETIGSELQGPIRENYAAYARDIANAARHLSALVDDLGDLEAVERADFSTAPDTIELGDVARRVAGLLALKAADHRIRIITPTVDRHIYATAEFRRVLQIMINLVSNAIRYSPDGTEIEIEIFVDETHAVVQVSDQGSGISADEREIVFEKFERLGRSGDGGSGLGLYISRRLARFMGGDLTVSDSEKGGAKFTLRLPKSD